MSILINSFAALTFHPGQQVLDKLCRECERRWRDGSAGGFNSQHLACIAHGLASLRHQPGEAFLQQLGTICEERDLKGSDRKRISKALAELRRLSE